MLMRKGQWPPGVSGNPRGRPSFKRPVEELARTYTEEAVETLVYLMHHGVPDSVRGAAATALLNRGWGLPRQVVEIEDDEEGFEAKLHEIESMSLEDVQRELARIALRREREEGENGEEATGLPGLVHDARREPQEKPHR
jgi:hypothetical protein